MATSVFHLGLNQAMLEGATLAIIPGDPERVAKIAALMDRPRLLASHREFTSYLAYIGDTPVVVCSTGIGGPSTSIAVEELAQCGIRCFLRVGTTGAIQSKVAVGDLIVTTASVRLDGASQHFAPLSYPAVADFECMQAMYQSALECQQTVHTGITASSDTFYPGQERYDTFSGKVCKSYQGSLEEWQNLGVLNYEMESATLFTMCNALGLQAGCVAGVIVNRTQQEIPSPEQMKLTEQAAMNVVVTAAAKMLKL